jgi:hypothetical protein
MIAALQGRSTVDGLKPLCASLAAMPVAAGMPPGMPRVRSPTSKGRERAQSPHATIRLHCIRFIRENGAYLAAIALRQPLALGAG